MVSTLAIKKSFVLYKILQRIILFTILYYNLQIEICLIIL